MKEWILESFICYEKIIRGNFSFEMEEKTLSLVLDQIE